MKAIKATSKFYCGIDVSGDTRMFVTRHREEIWSGTNVPTMPKGLNRYGSIPASCIIL
ncbi:hypothetical protein [Candidatus Brachybacter algidus]|uniref:hypothetical protein n=1 Tax=Candidatus Brachybacter algidus TaxID=2982024 RepID=UPI001DFF1255|nr:hypothetical protein [Candidatus Brachybacter algidus]MBK6450128.1 hypothetical protein [Candidatus Brachybacter algidus]